MIRYCLLAFALPVAMFAFGHGHDHNDGALQFHENKGQGPEHVFYRTLTTGGAVFVERTGFTYLLQNGGAMASHGNTNDLAPLREHAFKVHFEGGSAKAA